MLAVEQIRERVEGKAGNPVIEMRRFAGGHNTMLYLVDTQDREKFVVKTATEENGRLDLEGWMLTYLAKKTGLPVPKVIWAEPDMLVMTYISNSGLLDATAERHAADLIAALHQVEGERFGFECDTLIGPLHQPNNEEDSWITFFRDHRLLHMAREALGEGRIDSGLMKQIEKLAGKLDSYIEEPLSPVLLHGDLWGGNVLSEPGKITGFIDPAIYYGDAEVDLAFSRLFNTFGVPFFTRYNEISPLREGFTEVRKDIYNLYPLLVHVRLFGGAYTQDVTRIVNRFV